MPKQFPPSTKLNPCEACSDTKGKCRTVADNPDLIMCMTYAGIGGTVEGWRYQKDSGNGSWAIFGRDNTQKWTEEQQALRDADRAEKKRRREQEQRDRNVRLSDDETRDAEYQRDIKKYGINDLHRQEMVRRGMTPNQYEGWAYSVGSSLYLPVFSHKGLMVGHQIKTYSNSGAKYVWGRGGHHQRRSTGEQPMTHLGNREDPREIHFVESTGFKPKILSDRRPDFYVVGASGNQFTTSKAELTEILNRYPHAKLVYNSDAGASKNAAVELNTVKLYEFCQQHDGRKVEHVWYGQLEKSDGDIDEIAISTQFKRISHDKFMSISKNYRQYAKLSQMSKPAEKISSRYLPIITKPDLGSILFISSGVSSGKTERMMLLIEQHLVEHPNSRVISISYRNGLNDQSSKRWGITSYRVGHGQDYNAIQSLRKLAIVSDSICNLELSSVPANSLVVLDECEAVLKHIAIGGTTGALTTKVQAHFTQVLDRVLVSGGKVVALEDSITDTVIDGLLGILGNRYPSKVISNDYNCFNYDVNIGTGSKSDYIALALARLQIGERILVATTSQVFGEILEAMAVARIPATKGFVERLDSKTVSIKGDLISDPVAYLITAKAKMLELSPTVESGFSIDDKDLDQRLFDRVMAYFPNLDTRAHVQLLSRYRANCPRDIFIPDRSAEANSGGSTNPDAIYKMWMQTTLETSVQTGNGAVKMSPEAIAWNRLNANFQARQNISYLYSKSLLKSNLQSRGHKCTDVDWAKIALDVYSSNGLDIYDNNEIKQSFNMIKGQIEADQAIALAIANPGNMTREIATMVLKSSASSPVQRINAQKCLLQLDLPGADLTEEFLLEAIVKDRGRYRRQCELSFILDKRELASAIDKDLFGKQLESPHLSIRRTPKNLQTVTLFAPIIKDIKHLVSGGNFSPDNELVVGINKYLVSRSYAFYRLLGVTFAPMKIGNSTTYPIANVNKLIKKLGYRSEAISQLGTGKARVRVYAVTNHECPHRMTIEQALERYYANSTHMPFNTKDTYIETTGLTGESAASDDYNESIEEAAALLRLAIKYPEEYSIYRQAVSAEIFGEAAKLLSKAERSAIKKIVIEHKSQAA